MPKLSDYKALNKDGREGFVKNLSGEELREFAQEVADETNNKILRTLASRTNLTDEVIKRSLQQALGRFNKGKHPATKKTKPVELANWEKIKRAPYVEVEAQLPDPAKQQEFLTDFYNGESVVTNPDDLAGSVAASRAQAQLICDKMAGYGFANFSQLMSKFDIDQLNVEGAEQRARNISNAKQIKEYMEAILYLVETSDPSKRAEIANNFKDHRFVCGDGTLNNLMQIYNEMCLGKQDISHYVATTKRGMVEATVQPLYKSNTFVAAGMGYYDGNEVHDISSLINAIADEFGLVKKSKDRDRFIKDASQYQDILSQAVNATFSKPEAMEALVDTVTQKVLFKIETQIDKEGDDVKQQVQELLETLGIHTEFNYNHLVDVKSGKLKSNYADTVRMMVALSLDKRRLYDCPQKQGYERKLALEGSVNEKYEQCITKEALGEGLTKETWQYILTNGLILNEAEFGGETTKSIVMKKIEPFVMAENALRDAIEKEDVSAVTTILETDKGRQALLVRDNDGKTPIYRAARQGSKDIVAAILATEEGRRSLLIKDKSGKTLLHGAAAKGDKDIVAAILATEEGGKALLVRDNDGKTPLYRAAHEGNKDIVVAILATEEGRKSLLIRDNDGKTLLHWAAVYGQKDIVKIILAIEEGRRSLLIKDENGYTPLHWGVALDEHKGIVAAMLATEEARKALLIKDRIGNTPLHWAVEEGNKDIVAEILKTEEGRKALFIENNDGYTPLHWAAEKGHEDVVAEILKTEEGRQSLLIKDRIGNTPLHGAAYEGHKDVVAEILKTEEGRQSLLIKDKNGYTPLYWATYSGHKDVVAEILKTEEGKKALLVKDRYGKTPLGTAMAKGHKETVDIMLAHGAVPTLYSVMRHCKPKLFKSYLGYLGSTILSNVEFAAQAVSPGNMEFLDEITPPEPKKAKHRNNQQRPPVAPVR